MSWSHGLQLPQQGCSHLQQGYSHTQQGYNLAQPSSTGM
jgi:hypothetical protein